MVRVSKGYNAPLHFFLDVRGVPMKNHIVSVNNVIVGKVSEVDLSDIRRSVLRDPLVWLRQTNSVLRGTFEFMRMAVNMLVLLCTVGLLFVASTDPQSISTLLKEMSQSPDAVSLAASSVLTVWKVMCVILLVASILTHFTMVVFQMPMPKGLRDEFSNEVANRLREHLNVAADGAIRWWPESSLSSPHGAGR
jgi:hypothetical protein